MNQSVLIDSSGWIEYFSGGPLAAKYAKHIEAASRSGYVTPVIILYEIYKKIKSVKGEDAALTVLAHIIDHTTIVSITKKIAISAAEISLNTKLAMADAIIKAVAEDTNAKIITSDDHFKKFPDVLFIE